MNTLMAGSCDATIIVPTLGRVSRAVELSEKLLALDPPPQKALFVFQVQDELVQWKKRNSNPWAHGLLCEQRGAAQARNFGALKATTAFLVFLDDDCEPNRSDWLVALTEPFEQTDVRLSTGAVHGWHAASGSRPWMTRAFMLAPPFLTPWGNPAATRSSWCQTVAGGNFAVKKSLFDQHGGFSEAFASPSLYEETELSLRITAGRRKSIRFCADAAVTHRQEAEGGMREGLKLPFEQFVLEQKRFLLDGVYGRGVSAGVRFGLYSLLRRVRNFSRRVTRGGGG